uniref:Odorant receptor n=1 Tax=Heliothis virescens TaxID=7102 RepID=Q6A1J3_HELVI|nr:putative chemosensory receptor 21 [Heliothis virescens]
MDHFSGYYKSSKTTEFLINLNQFVFIFGLPNFWVQELDISDSFRKIVGYLNKYGNWSIFGLILAEYGAFFTQKNLNQRQSSDLVLFMISHSIITGFRVRICHQEVEIRNVMYKLGIALKEVHNDSEAEEQMIKRSKFFSWALILNCVISFLMYTIEAVLRVIRAGVTFTTVITVYPDVEDRSGLSNGVRVMFYIIWCIYLTRVFAVYTLVICLTIAMSHQFKNLTSYFYSLSSIFDDDQMTQAEKEQEYERAFRVGIKIHSDTLNCTGDIQKICRDVFSGQIIFNITLLIVLMYQMVNSARSLTNALTLVMVALSILLSTGFFMWNAGDITVEAKSLPTAMFSSGWEHCGRDSSVRVRKLIVIAMMQAQEPVVLTGLGIIALSYQSYVSIVKSSYSVFSVLY